MLETGYAPASVKNRHDGIRQFFAWCEEEGEVPEGRNPMRHVSRRRFLRILPTSYARMRSGHCSNVDGRSFDDRRDAALITLLYDTGLRLSECANITVTDIDIADRREVTVSVRVRERTLPIGANAARAMGRYLRMRRSHRDHALPALWLGIRGPMTPSGSVRRSSGAGSRPGWRRDPSSAEASFAHAWLAGGGEETDLMRLAGWSSRQMLARYAVTTATERARMPTEG